MCQQENPFKTIQVDLLHPLSILERPWQVSGWISSLHYHCHKGQWNFGHGEKIHQVCHLHSNKGSMCSGGRCEVVLQEHSEFVGDSFEYCVRQGHTVHWKVLDKVVQTCGNEATD